MGSAFFWISKLAWFAISPDTLFFLLVIVVWVLFLKKRYRKAKWLFSVLIIFLLILTLLPVGKILIFPLEKRFPTNPKLPDTVDGIIVLGGPENGKLSAFWDQAELGEGAERYLAFIMLARRYPKAKLVFTGGTGKMTLQEYKGADVAKRLFKSLDFDISRVIFEKDSRNTYENGIFSKALIKPDPMEKWILITTAWHMPRSVGIFCKIGWPVIPYPVDHITTPSDLLKIELNFSGHLNHFKTGIKEWMGLFVYYITGKTTGLFPGGCEH